MALSLKRFELCFDFGSLRNYVRHINTGIALKYPCASQPYVQFCPNPTRTFCNKSVITGLCRNNDFLLKCKPQRTALRNLFPFQLNYWCKGGSYRYYTSTTEAQIGETASSVNDGDDEEDYIPAFSEFAHLSSDAETEKKINLIIMEYVVGKQSGTLVPKKLTVKDMEELLFLSSFTGRKKYFEFACKKEWKKLSEKNKKEMKKLQPKEIVSPDHIDYRLFKNNIFMRIRESSMNYFYNCRQVYAAIFGQKFVVDLDYDDHMNRKEIRNTADQLQLLYADNKVNPDPFDLYFCNVRPDSPTLKFLMNSVPNLYESNCFIHVKSENYLDIFPKDRLVYLSPHAHEVMDSYDHDAVYIIGGIVDKSSKKPLSLAKAKREQIRILKLPLDKYLLWGSGSGKILTLNQMLLIMNEMKNTGNWEKALKFVPRRKVLTSEEAAEQMQPAFMRKSKNQLSSIKLKKIFAKESIFNKD